MTDPYTLSWAFNAATLIALWVYIRSRFRLPFRVYIVVCATCMPVAVPFSAYFFFAGDIVGVALLAAHLLRRPGHRQADTYATSVASLYTAALIAWPLISTYLAITYLNETAVPSSVGLFIIRSASEIGFFLWAARMGATVSSVKPLLLIPAATWMVFAALGMLQFAGVCDVDAFWYLHSEFKYLYAVTSGFMGMDKPQLAIWSSYATSVALWLGMTESGALGFALLSVPVLSLLTVLTIGSRQGLIGVTLASIITPFLLMLRKTDHFRLGRTVVVLITVSIIGPFVWNRVDADRRDRMLSQFEQLESITSVDQLARKRDSSIPDLIRFITDHPWRLYFGSGVGTESSDEQGADGLRTYAEGEYLRVLWTGGLISLVSYVGVLLIFVRQGIRNLLCKTPFQQGEAALLISTTLVGAFFAFGQFHLFTTMYHNAPCDYLLMMTAGLLGGAVTRSYSQFEARSNHSCEMSYRSV